MACSWIQFTIPVLSLVANSVLFQGTAIASSKTETSKAVHSNEGIFKAGGQASLHGNRNFSGSRVGSTTRKRGFGSRSECRRASTLSLRHAQRGLKLISFMCAGYTYTPAMTFKKCTFCPPSAFVLMDLRNGQYLRTRVRRGTFIIIGGKQTLPL